MISEDMKSVDGFVLRMHQRQAIRLGAEMAAGKDTRKVFSAGVTPGAGKTLMSALLSNVLADHGVIEQVLVVVPNNDLLFQMTTKFADRSWGLDRYLSSDDGPALPHTGRHFGKCVTYQLLTSKKKLGRLVAWVKKRPTLVIFDECHHMATSYEESKNPVAFTRGAEPLVDVATKVLCMSGTLWRWDLSPIPFIEYRNSKAVVDIAYSRESALKEHAILPVDFKFFNGRVVYRRGDLESEHSSLHDVPENKERDALRAQIMSPDYVDAFVNSSLRDWQLYTTRYASSGAIIVCHTKETAKFAHKVASSHFAEYHPLIAVSGDPGADRKINKFRRGDAKILVTVKKAYEGLDVPNATHLLYLSNVRSVPFMDQVVARVTRFNPHSELGYEDQWGHVYAPDDSRMAKYVNAMHEEQVPYFEERARRERVGGDGPRKVRSALQVIDGQVTEINYGSDVSGRLTRQENDAIRRFEQKYPSMRPTNISEKLDLVRQLGWVDEQDVA